MSYLCLILNSEWATRISFYLPLNENLREKCNISFFNIVFGTPHSGIHLIYLSKIYKLLRFCLFTKTNEVKYMLYRNG